MNIFDYLEWRGELPMNQCPFNEVDNLILCQLAYAKFDGILPDKFNHSMELKQAAEMYDKMKSEDAVLFDNKDGECFYRLLISSERFSSMKICGYVNHVDADEQKQFSAMTFGLNDGTYYVAYRGTDNTLVGWKEDLNMSFMSPIPAQEEAVRYLERAAKELPGRPKFRVGGHSKGGNLAVYASQFCSDRTRRYILDVYNNDGPGFRKEFKSLAERIHTFVPQSSIVGMLLEYEEPYTVIHSSSISGILQHNPFTWEVLGPRFVYEEDTDKFSQYIDRTLKDFMGQSFFSWDCHHIVYWLVTPPLTGWLVYTSGSAA